MPENLFTGTRHTIFMGISNEDGALPTEWYDLDFRSSHEDVERAAEEYLRSVFGGDVVIHHEDERLYVDEPGLPAGSLRRHYRFRQG